MNGKVNMKEAYLPKCRRRRYWQKLHRQIFHWMKKEMFVEEKIKARQTGDFPILDPGEVEYMDVAPNQIVGLSASLIPFLEHDDANRALMGSNMQRQAVPLIRPKPRLWEQVWKEKQPVMQGSRFMQMVMVWLSLLMPMKFMFAMNATNRKSW